MADLTATGGVEGPGAIARIAIGDMLRRSARRWPDRIALTEYGRRTTYAEIDRTANRLAHALIGRGLTPGTKVSTVCANSSELVAVLFALHRAGLVWVPINLMLPAEDVRYTLEHAGVGFAVIDPGFAEAPALGGVIREMGLPTLTCEAGFGGALDGMPDHEPDVPIHGDDLAMIIYTSGTTSKPKGAMHSHLSVVMAQMSNAIEMRLHRDSGVTLHLPLFHCAAHCLLLSFLLVGGKASIMRGFDPEAILRTIDQDRLTMCVGLPMMYAAMIDHPARAKYSTDSLELNIYTMAPMPRPLMERLIAEFSPNFTLTSGQTEMYPATCGSRPERQLERFGNYWGESFAVNDAAIMDDEGALLPPGVPGELVHRGPNVMLGYYRNPEATAEARAHGWHHTGDVAMIDAHGEILFLDRKKDMIKSGGENVSSVKVEEALLAHPAVAAAVAVGLPHPKWGEAVTGFVQLKPDAQADEADILSHCHGLLSGFQSPKRIVFVDAMPTTATGKLRKVEFRQSHAELYANDAA